MNKCFFISASRTEEPNETSLTIVELEDGTLRFHGVAGFPAHDIYELLVGDKKETNNERDDSEGC